MFESPILGAKLLMSKITQIVNRALAINLEESISLQSRKHHLKSNVGTDVALAKALK